MNKYVFLTVLLASVLVYAQSAPKPVALGLTERNARSYFSVQDFNYQDPTEKNVLGLYQYGFGSGQMDVSSGISSISAKSRNGFIVYGAKGKTGLHPFLGLAPVTGDVRMNTNPGGNNYYLLQSTVDPGVELSILGASLIVIGKTGFTASNYQLRDGMGPNAKGLVGYGAYAALYVVGAGFESVKFNGITRNLYDVCFFDKLHFQMEEDELNRQYTLAWRLSK